jgi:hypothetical protein
MAKSKPDNQSVLAHQQPQTAPASGRMNSAAWNSKATGWPPIWPAGEACPVRGRLTVRNMRQLRTVGAADRPKSLGNRDNRNRERTSVFRTVAACDRILGYARQAGQERLGDRSPAGSKQNREGVCRRRRIRLG